MTVRRLAAGASAPATVLEATDSERVPVPDPGVTVHLHFSRFADCPVCNLHIAQLRRRTPDLRRADIRTVAVFHSPAEHVRRYRADMPFVLVADPDRVLYRRFGVGTSRRALWHPRAVRRLVAEARMGHRAQEAHGGVNGLPADFLISPDGRVRLAHYGAHADDNVPVDELIAALRPELQPGGSAT